MGGGGSAKTGCLSQRLPELILRNHILPMPTPSELKTIHPAVNSEIEAQMFEDNLLRHFCESSFKVKSICWFGPRMDTHTQSISNLEKWFKEMFFISITEFEFHFVNLHYSHDQKFPDKAKRVYAQKDEFCHTEITFSCKYTKQENETLVWCEQ